MLFSTGSHFPVVVENTYREFGPHFSIEYHFQAVVENAIENQTKQNAAAYISADDNLLGVDILEPELQGFVMVDRPLDCPLGFEQYDRLIVSVQDEA